MLDHHDLLMHHQLVACRPFTSRGRCVRRGTGFGPSPSRRPKTRSSTSRSRGRASSTRTWRDTRQVPEFLALKQESKILGHSSSPVCGFSMIEQVRLCAVLPMENWLGSSVNHIQGCTTVRESYSRACEQGPLASSFIFPALQL